MNWFQSNDITHSTDKEMAAMSTILNSPRGGAIVHGLILKMVDADPIQAGPFFISMISQIASLLTKKQTVRSDNMRSFVRSLGRSMTCCKVPSGERQGEPAFLTKKFAEMVEISTGDVITFVRDFCNFKESDEKFKLGQVTERLTASSVCSANALAKVYLDNFIKIIDGMKSKSIEELFPTCYAFEDGDKELLTWCFENRKLWDDVTPKPAKMTAEEFKALCKSYFPDCIFKEEGTCGLLCYNKGLNLENILVGLLPRGDFSVYDMWRDCTITDDREYLENFLKTRSGR